MANAVEYEVRFKLDRLPCLSNANRFSPTVKFPNFAACVSMATMVTI